MSALLMLPLLAAAVDLLTDDPHPQGVVLSGPFATGPKGTPLYTVEGTCDDECQKAWPPLPASETDKPIGDWYPYQGQWTFKRRFVYYFDGDQGSSRASGDGAGNKWFAIRHLGRLPKIPSPPNAKVSKSGSSFILSDHRGHALYSFARDGKAPACTAECLEVWPPLLAPMLAEPIGDWRPVDRPDGVRQWAFRGRLLYTFSEDVKPADQNGSNAGGVWQLVNVESARDVAVRN